MASSISITLFLLLSIVSPALSLTCSSQRFTNNKVFDKCTDLPSLGGYLHWTYTKPDLSIAFIAPPATSNGWIAWAINPTGRRMAGSQALIAFKGANGLLTAQTYNISSYSSIVQSKIAFEVSDLSAVQSGNNFQIFATLALPANMTTINQVWQVGSAVNNGQPAIHAFKPENLQSTGTVNLLPTVTAPVGAPHPSAHSPSPSKFAPLPNSPSPRTSPAPGIPKSGGSKIGIGSSVGILILSVFVMVCFC